MPQAQKLSPPLAASREKKVSRMCKHMAAQKCMFGKIIPMRNSHMVTEESNEW
jgi:hypothetical protein